MIRIRLKVRPWVAAEKQHIEMFSGGNFVLSKTHLICSEHCSLKKWFSSSFLENAMENAMG